MSQNDEHDALAEIASATEMLVKILPLYRDHLNGSLETPDLTPEFSIRLSILRTVLQQYATAEQLATRHPVAEAPHEKPIIKTTAITNSAPSGMVDQPKTTTTSGGNLQNKAVQSRRKQSDAYDYLLLLAFAYAEQIAGPIGQKTLLKLAEAFDPNTKKSSLIAKLNRWKNANGYLTWTDARRLSIKPAGARYRDELREIVIADGDGPKIAAAFKSALNVDITL